MMQGMDPNLLLQWLQQQRGGTAQPQQAPSFGFAPPPIDQTPGPFTGAGIARAHQQGPGLPPMPGAAPQQASGGAPSALSQGASSSLFGPQIGASDGSQSGLRQGASQWASQQIFGPQLGPGGLQPGVGGAGMMSLLKMFGL